MSVTEFTGNMAIVDDYISSMQPQIVEAYLKIKFLEPSITDDMRSLSKKLNTDFEGLQYSVKTASSVCDKLERTQKELDEIGEDFDGIQEINSMKDVIRYTEICNHDDIMEIASKTIDTLKNEGYILSQISNYYVAPYPDTGYQGLHLNFITPYGQEIELQVHSKESFDAKQQGHKLYEAIRSVSLDTTDKEIYKKEIKDIHGSIKKPKNFDKFPKKYILLNKKAIIEERRKKSDVKIEMDDYKKNPRTLSYSVYNNKQKIFCGFENIMSDGSAKVYHNNIKSGYAKCGALMSNGQELSRAECVPIEYTFEEARKMAENGELLHAAWMQENMQLKKQEDLDIVYNNKYNQIEKGQEPLDIIIDK